MVYVEWNNRNKAAFTTFPEILKFSTQPPDNYGEAPYHRFLTRSLSTLTRATRTPTDEVMQLLRTFVLGPDPGDHAGRDAQVQRVRDAAIAVEDDEDEASGVVSWSTLHWSVADLIVAVDAQGDGPAQPVLLQVMEKFEAVNADDTASWC